MSDETPKAAELPDRHRNNPPVKPRTVRGLPIGDSGYIHIDSLYIGSEWGVWIDPNAAVEHPLPDNPAKYVLVTRGPDGYHLNSGPLKKTWDRHHRRDFPGFIPVAKFD